jgi:hypothetical protein
MLDESKQSSSAAYESKGVLEYDSEQTAGCVQGILF